MLILFDGLCNLCSSSVNFIIKRDKDAVFRFSPIQSNYGKYQLSRFNIDENIPRTLVLIYNNTIYQKSDAVIEIGKYLGWFWKLSSIFKLIPRLIRNTVYDFITGHRYQWFGKRADCMIPDDETKWRFLE